MFPQSHGAAHFAFVAGVLLACMGQTKPAAVDQTHMIEAAEAKRRGVSVEQVLLEQANTRLAEITAQVAALQAQIQKLNQQLQTAKDWADTYRLRNDELEKSLAEKNSALAAATQPHDAISDAIKAHKLAAGMTLAQAEEAMGGKGRQVGRDPDGSELYQWQWYDPTMVNRPTRLLEQKTARFKNAKLVSWQQDPVDQ